MKYRLGLDLGTNSLGWAAVQLSDELEPRQLLDMNVRIFSDARNPKDKSSNAAQRRGPRGARRNRDRRLGRKSHFMRALIKAGLMPKDKAARKSLEAQDPWILRTRTLDEKLPLHEVGRALFHLQQRRGFKSNRKTDGKEDGVVYDGIKAAQERMTHVGARTLGELFGRPRLEQWEANKTLPAGERKPLPKARVRKTGEGTKLAYDYYPLRKMILDEFNAIWEAQSRFHGEDFPHDHRERIFKVLEHQRDLKPQKAGKCTFIPTEPRAPKALPTVQYARILGEVNNLRVGATGETKRELTPDERKKLVAFLQRPSNKQAKRTFSQIRKELALPDSQSFNLETEKRDHLVGDLTAAALMDKKLWGPSWHELSLEAQDAIVEQLLNEEDEAELFSWLGKTHGIEEGQALAISKLSLPEAHGKLSKKALDRLIPHLESGLRYDEAAEREFGDHRGDVGNDGAVPTLPYYGQVLSRHTAFEKDPPKTDKDERNAEERFGRVANPTVHVALGQIKAVVNDLIKRYGIPEQIVLEMARDLPLSDRGLKELERNQKANQDKNDSIRQRLEKEFKVNPESYDNRLKLRLYDEACAAFDGKALCVFSGEAIGVQNLFSDAIQIEHILPNARTWDDSYSNKVLATTYSNQIKSNKTPFEAFGHNPNGFDWEAISQRARQLPSYKEWRFDPDAMELWENRGTLQERYLNDTRYIGRLAKNYVEKLYGGQGKKGEENRVWVVTGQLTSDLRHFAGFNTLTGFADLNYKDRTDHRHHAVDALVIALTDRSMVKRASDLAKLEDYQTHRDIMVAMAEPLKRYRKSIEDRLRKLTVSHKPDHGFEDAMHNETAYGITGEVDEKGQHILVTRKPLAAMDKPADLEKIRDEHLRNALQEATQGLSGKDFNAALIAAGENMNPPVYNARIIDPFNEKSFVTITDKHGHAKAYKGDGNYCYDIWVNKKGKWTGEVITTFQAYQLAQKAPKWWQKNTGRKGQPLIMRIRKGDMIELDGPNGERIRTVVYKFSTGKLEMSEHFQANASARVRAKELDRIQRAPSALQRDNAIQITVSPSGKVSRLQT